MMWYNILTNRIMKPYDLLNGGMKVVQSCLTLFDPMDYTVHGIILAIILEWVAYPFSSVSSWPRNQTEVSCITGGFFTNGAILNTCRKSFQENSSCVYDKNSPESGNKGDVTQHCAVCLVTQSCPILCDPMNCNPPGFSVHGDSPSRNIGLDCHALLQGIFPTQRPNPGLPHCRWIIYCLSHKEAQEYWSE